MKVFLNGSILDERDAHISVLDRGFLFGDGVYELLRYFDGYGVGVEAHARRLAASSVVHTTVASLVVTVAMMAGLSPLLTWLGAEGEAHAVASRFLLISMPSNVLMGLGMAYSGVLRAVGDARRSMYVTLAGGIATAVIDPLLIFGAGLGAEGAA